MDITTAHLTTHLEKVFTQTQPLFFFFFFFFLFVCASLHQCSRKYQKFKAQILYVVFVHAAITKSIKVKMRLGWKVRWGISKDSKV